MSESMALQHPGSELMSWAVVTEGHADDQGLVGHLRSRRCLRTELRLGPS